jgi:hypothetical protein
MNINEATKAGAVCSFSLFGINENEEICVPGSGFLVAPSLGLTAKHVSEEIVYRLGIPEGMEAPRVQTLFRGVHVRAALQEIGRVSDELTPWWSVDGFFDSKISDISVLVLSPGNEGARRADESDDYLIWSLSPPALGQHLWAFGYAKESLHRETQTQNTNATAVVRYSSSTQPVSVSNVFAGGRRQSLLDVPAILGSDRLSNIVATQPCFEVSGEITPSMSGGPVFDGDVLYGVVSRGTLERGDDGIDRHEGGVVALLKPLLEMGTITLGEGSPGFKVRDLISSAAIRSLP